ncbi:phytoene/squalene synthase family protein [Tepidamorphus sp. 3E244]|uniref:phytoene/squalene synthase family protein n=1 Tax=Tepidamorphus sp. 3E244 TaxID=3385498 RepID=UPI0038FC0108
MSDLSAAYAFCGAQLRAHDKDRFLSILFSPAEKRPHLYALHAFSAEITNVRDKVSEPMPGEIRLQWWMDVVRGERASEAASNPIAHALTETMARFSLPAKALVDMIDARIFDLYDDPMPTLGDFVGYAGETSSALMQMSAIILNDGEAPNTADIAGHGGVACTMARVLCNLPKHIAHGQLYIPLDMLNAHGVCREDVLARETTPEVRAVLKDFHDAADDHVAAMGRYLDQIPAKVAPAFLQTALVRHYLAAHAALSDPLNEVATVPQWRRQWILWRAARNARKICCGQC